MSQRSSGYDRIPWDRYETPDWPLTCLSKHIPPSIRDIFDPCCGTGNIVKFFSSVQFTTSGRDIQEDDYDFLKDCDSEFDAIITNPPYSQAEEFIAHALSRANFVAMLLRTDYDHAKTRAYLFDHPWFHKQIKLRTRIVFMETEGVKAAPSFWHSWFIWNKNNQGAPTVAYEKK